MAVLRLSPRDLNALKMHLEGSSSEEIAQTMQLSLSSVKREVVFRVMLEARREAFREGVTSSWQSGDVKDPKFRDWALKAIEDNPKLNPMPGVIGGGFTYVTDEEHHRILLMFQKIEDYILASPKKEGALVSPLTLEKRLKGLGIILPYNRVKEIYEDLAEKGLIASEVRGRSSRIFYTALEEPAPERTLVSSRRK